MRKIIVVVSLFFSFNIFAQSNSEYIKILEKFEHDRIDTSIINRANEIALDLETNSSYDSALIIIGKSIEQSKKLKYKYGEATAEYLNSIVSFRRGDIEKGLNSLIE